MHERLTLQVLSCPQDLFVEQRIFEIDRMRPVQLLSLLQMEEISIKGGNHADINSGLLPKFIVDISKTLSLVSSLMLKKLYGIDMTAEHHPSKRMLAQAQDMFEEYEAYVPSYRAGDEYDLVEYFIEVLDYGKYVTISDFKPDSPDSCADNDSKDDLLTPEERKKQEEFAASHDEATRDPMIDMMMSMYMLAALERFDGMPKHEVKNIAMEIATLGLDGIDTKKSSGYEVPGLEGNFSGYQLLAYYYVSFKIAIPEMLKSLNLPFDGPYQTAFSMFNNKKKGGN